MNETEYHGDAPAAYPNDDKVLEYKKPFLTKQSLQDIIDKDGDKIYEAGVKAAREAAHVNNAFKAPEEKKEEEKKTEETKKEDTKEEEKKEETTTAAALAQEEPAAKIPGKDNFHWYRAESWTDDQYDHGHEKGFNDHTVAEFKGYPHEAAALFEHKRYPEGELYLMAEPVHRYRNNAWNDA